MSYGFGRTGYPVSARHPNYRASGEEEADKLFMHSALEIDLIGLFKLEA